MTKYTVGSCFAGMGGFDLAATWAGFRVAWQIEKADYARRIILARHWPDATHYGDIFDCHDLPYADVFTAGFPCQPFSIAGKGKGDRDERYLVPEMLRIIKEAEPRVVFLENVPRFRTLDGGIYFKRVLRAFAGMGYDAQWGRIRASDVGAPHLRERWLLVAYADRQRLAEPTFATDGADLLYRERDNTLYQRSGPTKFSAHESSGAIPNANSERKLQPQGISIVGRRRSGNGYQALSNANGRRRQPYHAGFGRVSKSHQGRAPVQHSGRQRRGHHVVPPIHDRMGFAHRRFDARHERSGRDGDECRLGGIHADGLPDWFFQTQWAAPLGLPAYDYEPPRLIDKDADPNRNARVEAIGNAVVPQVVYPIFLAIREYLEAQDGVR